MSLIGLSWVTVVDAFKHLICYCDKTPDGCDRWRFASHPRFPYWALNMKQRHQLLSQSNLFIKQNPGDTHLTIERHGGNRGVARILELRGLA